MISKRQIKSKISATQNIRQITKAMEMVSATKMRKAEEIALQSRPFAKESLSLMRNLLSYVEKNGEIKSHYFKRKDINKSCLVVVTSDKGLAGAFNSNVLRRAMKFIEENPDVDVVTMGKKAKEFLQKRNIKIVNSFDNSSDTITLSDVAPMSDWLIESYKEHTYDSISFCSTIFVSALVSKVEISEVLPLTVAGLQEIIKRIVPKKGRYSDIQDNDKESATLYTFEPSPNEVFENILEDLVRVEILYMIFESNASEHSSRMMAMKTATESAKDLIDGLTLDLNKARQAAITQELAEISTAKEALSQN